MEDTKSRLGLLVNEDLHLEVKKWCVDNRMTVKDFTEKSWREKLDRERAKAAKKAK
jgi:hypothetical protein